MTKRLDPDPRVAACHALIWEYCVRDFKRTHTMCDGDEELMVQFAEGFKDIPVLGVFPTEFLERLWNAVREYREENDC